MLVRSFLIGLLAALGLIVALFAVDGPGGALLLAAPLVALGGVAVFGSGVAGWRARAARGVIGATLAGAGGLAAIFYLKSRTDWFDWPADSAGDLFFALLTAHAAIPGALAAAAAPPSRGLALAAGFCVGITALWLTSGGLNPGVLILLGLGAAIGGLVGSVRR